MYGGGWTVVDGGDVSDDRGLVNADLRASDATTNVTTRKSGPESEVVFARVAWDWSCPIDGEQHEASA
jgi:hypothetical protein